MKSVIDLWAERYEAKVRAQLRAQGFSWRRARAEAKIRANKYKASVITPRCTLEMGAKV